MFGGLPCGSWVWISQGTSKRLESIEGNTDNKKIRQANEITARFATLAIIAMALGINWVVTWPGCSCKAFNHVGTFRVGT